MAEELISNFVEFRNVSFYRDDKMIFDNLSLQIPKGKITAILGPSGTGKTTLLRLVTGQLKPTSGSVLLDGICINELSRGELFELRKRMSLLFQTGALFTDMNVFENVAFPLREHTQLPEHMIRDLVLLKLESVGLRGVARKMPSQLSGGMARRVALARSMVLDPELIMYDEPFTGQDPISMGVLLKLITAFNTDLAITSMLVSHDVSEAMSIAHQVFVIAAGHVIGKGTPEQLSNNPDPQIRQFLFGEPDGPVAFHAPAIPFKEEMLSHAE